MIRLTQMDKFNNFHYAMYLANQLYDLNILPDNFEEIGLVAWNQIGNKRNRLYRICLEVSPQNNSVELPSNCDEIEAVTYGFEDWNYTSSTLPNGDYNSQFVESYIESKKAFKDPLYVSGRYVKYTRVGDTLYLDQSYGGRVNILYKGEILDEEGLPQITDKEALAIATFCAYLTKFKEGLRTNNPNTIKFSQELERKWYTQCDEARVPDYISQNEMNEILDAKTSWNRKIFNKSLKPTK